MISLSLRTRRIILLLALFAVSFSLYVAAESGSQAAEVVLLGLLAALMAVAILLG